jgi:hypothetical protein
MVKKNELANFSGSLFKFREKDSLRSKTIDEMWWAV